MRVVLCEQAHGEHDVVDVAEDEGALGGVAAAGAQERGGLLAPVAPRVQVVRGVVAVVVAVAVGLFGPGRG